MTSLRRCVTLERENGKQSRGKGEPPRARGSKCRGPGSSASRVKGVEANTAAKTLKGK